MKLRFRRMMGGRVIPEDEETQEALMKYKVGDILEADFKRKRNPGFHLLRSGGGHVGPPLR